MRTISGGRLAVDPSRQTHLIGEPVGSEADGSSSFDSSFFSPSSVGVSRSTAAWTAVIAPGPNQIPTSQDTSPRPSRDEAASLGPAKGDDIVIGKAVALEVAKATGGPRGRVPSYPPTLVVFVCLIAILSGVVVMGVHYAVICSGCPLGLNGCHSFLDIEETEPFLVRWVDRASEGRFPKDCVYICCSFIGAVLFTEIIARLPENVAAQVQGGGTVQALAAVASGERIKLTAAAARIVVTSIYLGSGGTLGMDGPAIQVCTAIACGVGCFLGMQTEVMQSLLACLGFAGAFAASFHAPLVGLIFAMEELQYLSSAISKHIICMVLMASVVANAAARMCPGGERSLLDLHVDWETSQNFFTGHLWMLVSVPIAILCSFVGLAISQLLCMCWRFVDSCGHVVTPRVVTILMVLTSASIDSVIFRATGLGGVWGIGYESMQEAFSNHLFAHQFFIFAAGKTLAMILSLSVGCPGDIFGPVLICGGFLGGGIGSLLQQLIEFDDLASEVVIQPCIIFGMVSLFASCFRFPLTPVFIVLDFMGQETWVIALPSALAGFIAITLSNKLFPPLLDSIMHRHGISVPNREEEENIAGEDAKTIDVEEEAQSEYESEYGACLSQGSGSKASSGGGSTISKQIGAHIQLSMTRCVESGNSSSSPGLSPHASHTQRHQSASGSGTAVDTHRMSHSKDSAGSSSPRPSVRSRNSGRSNTGTSSNTGSNPTNRKGRRSNSDHSSGASSGTITTLGFSTVGMPFGTIRVSGTEKVLPAEPKENEKAYNLASYPQSAESDGSNRSQELVEDWVMAALSGAIPASPRRIPSAASSRSSPRGEEHLEEEPVPQSEVIGARSSSGSSGLGYRWAKDGGGAPTKIGNEAAEIIGNTKNLMYLKIDAALLLDVLPACEEENVHLPACAGMVSDDEVSSQHAPCL